LTVLVTGSSGFIGSHLVKKLKQEHRVVALIHDDVPSRWLDEGYEGTIKVKGDIRDQGLVRRILNQYDVTEVFHLAALAKVKQAYKDPVNVFDINVMGTVSILEACRQLEVKRTMVLITDKVYGEKVGATEEDRLQSSEPYATSKACAQFVAESYRNTYGMEILIPHSCNAFGLDLQSNRLFTNTIKDCLRGVWPTIFRNDKSIREYIYIDDLVEALNTLMYDTGVSSEPTGIYNISTGWVFNQMDIVLKILEGFPGLSPRYIDAELPRQIQEQTMRSIVWDWKPSWAMDDAIDKTIELFKLYEKDWNWK